MCRETDALGFARPCQFIIFFPHGITITFIKHWIPKFFFKPVTINSFQTPSADITWTIFLAYNLNLREVSAQRVREGSSAVINIISYTSCTFHGYAATGDRITHVRRQT